VYFAMASGSAGRLDGRLDGLLNGEPGML